MPRSPPPLGSPRFQPKNTPFQALRNHAVAEGRLKVGLRRQGPAPQRGEEAELRTHLQAGLLPAALGQDSSKRPTTPLEPIYLQMATATSASPAAQPRLRASGHLEMAPALTLVTNRRVPRACWGPRSRGQAVCPRCGGKQKGPVFRRPRCLTRP